MYTLFGQSGVSVPTATEGPNSVAAPVPRLKQGRIWRVSPDKHAGQRVNCKIKEENNTKTNTERTTKDKRARYCSINRTASSEGGKEK